MNRLFYERPVGFAFRAIGASAAMLMTGVLVAQDDGEDDDDIVTLSPFEVDGSADEGYRATNTLAGTRISTNLEDIGSAISVLTEQFIEDVGGVDNQTVLSYALGTEVGGSRGNYSGGVTPGGGGGVYEEGLFESPNSNTRVRGLSRADNTRNYFLTNVPWDGYNVNRVDLQRGPNAILFGLGSPAGVINASTISANYGRDRGEVTIRNDQFGSLRTSLDYNMTLIEDQLAVRVAALRDRQNFRQEPTYENDDRYYAAIKYRPAALNSESVLFELSANYENGDIDANRSRTIPPVATYFTSWAAPVDQGGLGGRSFDQRDAADRAYIDEQDFQLHGPSGPVFYVNGDVGPDWFNDRIDSGYGSRDSNGDIVGTIVDGSEVSGYVYGTDLRRIEGRDRVQRLEAAYDTLSPEMQSWLDAGLISNNTLEDPTIFDFYNKSFEGPNKGEFRNWDSYDLQVNNTFFNNKLGYNISFHKEDVEFFRYGMAGWFNFIYIDPDERLMDTQLIDGEVILSENPNALRPYMEEQLRFNTRERFTDSEALRAQIFGEHDFSAKSDHWFARLIGKHSVTALYEEQEQEMIRYNYAPGGFGPDYYNTAYPTSGGDASANGLHPKVRYYLGDPVQPGQTSLAGANFEGITQDVMSMLAGVHTVRYWDPTWIAGEIYGNPWTDPDGVLRTESANPANYQGWTEDQFRFYTMLEPDQIVEGTNQTVRDYFREGTNYSLDNIESQVFVWQGYFWNQAIVGTYGYREDTPSKSTQLDEEPTDVFEGAADNTSWSVAAHVNRLLGEKDVLPLNVSLYYTEGENIQPLVGRIGADGVELPSPAGSTEEWSVLLRTKDNKYSLRATEYETVVNNQTLTARLDNWIVQQAISRLVVTYDELTTQTDRESLAQATSQENADYIYDTVVPATTSFFQEFESTYPGFVETWVRGEGYTFLNPPPYSGPDAITNSNNIVSRRGNMTEDAVSTGYEFEFTANPTDNWRIAINASKTKAIRDQVPGPSWIGPIELLDNAIMNTEVGNLPLWSADDTSSTARTGRWPLFRAQYYQARALNGLYQPEIREWRYNMITNYSFKEGVVDGLGVGGALKWADENIIEFYPTIDEAGNVFFDLERPITAESESTVDLWASYRRDLTDNITWKIQLNLYNVFGENELVPVNVDPDGTPVVSRIKEGTSWALTNTFEF